MDDKPKKQNFAITVTYNEIFKRWVAIDNKTQEIIGYGNTSEEAFIDYLKQNTN